MIYVLYTPGSFGSTVEYIVRRFSKEFALPDVDILEDGSMHGYNKEFHAVTLENLLALPDQSGQILSAVYPNVNTQSKEVLTIFQSKIKLKDKVIFITCPTVEQFTLVTLCSFTKAQSMQFMTPYLDCNAHRWNNNYNKLSDMKIWEQRELLSLTLFDVMNQILFSSSKPVSTWFAISAQDIIDRLPILCVDILDYLELTAVDHTAMADFIQKWLSAQQSYIDRSCLIHTIVQKIISNESFDWLPLTFNEEALLQCQLLHAGYEIACNDLDTFPTQADVFYNFLIPYNKEISLTRPSSNC
jgi:hypothetical protein